MSVSDNSQHGNNFHQRGTYFVQLPCAGLLALDPCQTDCKNVLLMFKVLNSLIY